LAAARALVRREARHLSRSERGTPGVALSDRSRQGLRRYLEGPVYNQLVDDLGAVPPETGFVFGHTHKPFVETRACPAFPNPVAVVNTGGWVVDTPTLNPVKGASLVLIDEQLNVAALRCYTEGPDATSYRLRVEPAGGGDGSNDLVDELRAAISPDRDPWARLAQLTQSAVADRGRQLIDRQDSDASMLNELNLQAEAEHDPR
jgi:hypothetical protein